MPTRAFLRGNGQANNSEDTITISRLLFFPSRGEKPLTAFSVPRDATPFGAS